MSAELCRVIESGLGRLFDDVSAMFAECLTDFRGENAEQLQASADRLKVCKTKVMKKIECEIEDTATAARLSQYAFYSIWVRVQYIELTAPEATQRWARRNENADFFQLFVGREDIRQYIVSRTHAIEVQESQELGAATGAATADAAADASASAIMARQERLDELTQFRREMMWAIPDTQFVFADVRGDGSCPVHAMNASLILMGVIKRQTNGDATNGYTDAMAWWRRNIKVSEVSNEFVTNSESDVEVASWRTFLNGGSVNDLNPQYIHDSLTRMNICVVVVKKALIGDAPIAGTTDFDLSAYMKKYPGSLCGEGSVIVPIMLTTGHYWSMISTRAIATAGAAEKRAFCEYVDGMRRGYPADAATFNQTYRDLLTICRGFDV